MVTPISYGYHQNSEITQYGHVCTSFVKNLAPAQNLFSTWSTLLHEARKTRDYPLLEVSKMRVKLLLSENFTNTISVSYTHLTLPTKA